MLRSRSEERRVGLEVAVLFPAGSLVPAGAVTVAVLLIVPDPLAVAVTVNVAVPPLVRSTSAFTLPLPLAGQAEPTEATHVHVGLVRCPANTSLTVAPTTALGPALLATIV